MGVRDWHGETEAEINRYRREAQEKHGTGNFLTPADAYAAALKAKREKQADHEKAILGNLGPETGRNIVSSATNYSSPGGDAATDLAAATSPPSMEPTTFPSMPPMPTWEKTPEQLHDTASNYAGIQVDPVKQALARSIEQAKLDADSQSGRIEAAYAGVPAELEKMEGRQARSDLESAVSRGGGRSGAVEWASAHRGEHYASLLAQAEGQKAAELTAIANQLGLTKKQAEERKIELEQLRGMLIQDHLFNLESQMYDRGMQQWTTGANHAFGVFDRTMLTPMQRWQLYFQGADTFRGAPSGVPGPGGSW